MADGGLLRRCSVDRSENSVTAGTIVGEYRSRWRPTLPTLTARRSASQRPRGYGRAEPRTRLMCGVSSARGSARRFVERPGGAEVGSKRANRGAEAGEPGARRPVGVAVIEGGLLLETRERDRFLDVARRGVVAGVKARGIRARSARARALLPAGTEPTRLRRWPFAWAGATPSTDTSALVRSRSPQGSRQWGSRQRCPGPRKANIPPPIQFHIDAGDGFERAAALVQTADSGLITASLSDAAAACSSARRRARSHRHRVRLPRRALDRPMSTRVLIADDQRVSANVWRCCSACYRRSRSSAPPAKGRGPRTGCRTAAGGRAH